MMSLQAPKADRLMRPIDPAGATVRRPRVLHIGPMPPAIGGMAVNVANYLRSDVSRAFEVEAVRSDLVGKLSRQGPARSLFNLGNAAVLAAVITWKLVTFRPALVHIRTNSYGGFFEKCAFALLARAFGARVLLHVHGGAFRTFYESSGRFVRRAIRSCLDVNDRVIALSEEMRSALLATGVAPGKVVVVENAVFLPSRTVLESDPGGCTSGPAHDPTVRLLFLNRLEAAKGVFDLLEAVIPLCRKHPGLSLRLIGPASEASLAVLSRVAQEGLSGRIEVGGTVTGEAKESGYLDADVYVLPSHVEAMPMGLLEAMSYGLACVATRVGAVGSVIQDGVSGLLVAPGDSDALARALDRLVMDASLRQRLGRCARETIETRFNWRDRARQMIDLYHDLLRTGRVSCGQ